VAAAGVGQELVESVDGQASQGPEHGRGLAELFAPQGYDSLTSSCQNVGVQLSQHQRPLS
jgi:hypothetical protein